MVNRILILTFVCGLFLFGACRNDTVNKRVLTVSIEPQRYLLEQIAGQDWTINTMLSNGSNPETFDPPMSALKLSTNSAAYFKVGTIAFEDVLVQKIGNRLTIVDTSAGISLLHGTHNCDNPGHRHNNDDADPHVWSSVRNAKIMARNMLNAMKQLDAENSDIYQKNYDQLVSKLDSLDRVIAEILVKKQGKTFVTWHPSLSYFAHDYSLNQLAIGAENKEMSADAFRSKIDQIRTLGVEVMLLQPEMDNSRTEEIARQAGIHTTTINLLGYDWPEQMVHVAKSI